MREIGPGIYDPGQFWLHAGPNQNASGSDPACFLGTEVIFYTCVNRTDPVYIYIYIYTVLLLQTQVDVQTSQVIIPPLLIRLLTVDARHEKRERETASNLPMLAGVYLKSVIRTSYKAWVRKVHPQKDFKWPADKKDSACLRKVHPEKELDHLLEKGQRLFKESTPRKGVQVTYR